VELFFVDREFDVAVIGSGPGGYVAGIRAAQLGLKTCVIEEDKPGGVCLNMGCIPTKTLIHQAEIFSSRDELEKMGLKIENSGFNYEKVFSASRKAAETLSRGVQYLLKKNEVNYIQARGTLKSREEIQLDDGSTINGKNIIIATGSKPKRIPGFDFDENKVLSSRGAIMLRELPESICILGGGAIGCEFAHIFSSFGVEVHLVEMMATLLPLEDAEVTNVLEKGFKKRGIKVYTETKAHSFKKNNGHLDIILGKEGNGNYTVSVRKLLVVVGREPRTDDIGLENIGLKVEKGFIPVKDYYQTYVNGVYAVGDVVNSPLLAHVASREGEIASEHIAGRKTLRKIDIDLIPGAVYTSPQVASFGKTESQVQEAGISYKKALFPYRGTGKSVAIGKTEGLVKVLTDSRTGEILGAHIAGAQATELIHELLLAKSSELLPADIAHMIHAHPTLSEISMEVMKMVLDQAIHI
jgi:dihydrolipoamide dehydrogenase